MSKTKIEHEMLDSKIATAVALFNEWIKWCDEQGLRPRTVTDIPALFLSFPDKLDEKGKKS